MDVKIVTMDAGVEEVPKKITARWLKLVLPFCIIRRNLNGRYDLVLPNGENGYLFGHWNNYFTNDAMRSLDGLWINDDVICQTIWEYRTSAAETILNDLIDECCVFEDSYDLNETFPVTLALIE